MFKFLKEKIKQAVNKITHKVEAEVPSKEESLFLKGSRKEQKEEVVEKPSIGFQKDLEVVKQIDKLEKFDKEIGKKELDKEVIVEKVTDVIEKVEKGEKKGFFVKLKEKIATKKIDEARFNELFWELELALLENNVAVEVIDKIKEDLRKNLVDKPINRGEVDGIIEKSLKESIFELLDIGKIDVVNLVREKGEKPFVIVFFGVNGVGKTTTIAKLSKLFLDNNFRVVLGAADTFRKGSIEQLDEWGKRLGVKVIKQQYGADSASVCFDTVAFAKSHNLDVVILDTAGRQHSNKNLMDELNKINKVVRPDFKIFVAESIVGNDAVEQSKIFNEKVGIDGIILTKTDVDEKGGAIVSIGYASRKPILYLGCGQNLGDLKMYSKEEIIRKIGL